MSCNAGRRTRLRATLRSPDPALVLPRRCRGGCRGVVRHRRTVRAGGAARSPLSAHRPHRHAAGSMDRKPIPCAGARAPRARRFHHHDPRGVSRRPESLPQHRTDPGVDHRLGRSRLCFRVRGQCLGADQSLADNLRIDRDYRPRDHRAARVRPAPALSGVARRLARVHFAARVRLDRARLPEPGGPVLHRVACPRLLPSDFRRHVPVRPRVLARARRGFHGGVRHIRAFCADRDTNRRPSRHVLRPFGAGLIEGGSVSTSMMAFVLLLLATVLYDGALGTPEWGKLEGAIAAHLSTLGDFKLLAIRTAGLFAFWLVFCGAYVGVSAVMSAVTQRRLAPLAIARSFAFTLVPIAIGYHFAHYFTFLLIQGQYIIPLASDPFGFGWNLFGTAGYRVDIAIVDARFAWLTAVAAILIGHIAAVYLAHVKAMQVLDTRRMALRSQVPLTALMVIYTFVSLSILAEPIVERRAPAQPIAAAIDVPEDALLPEPGSGRLQPVGAGKIAKQKLTYRVLGSAFHDG